MSREPNAETVRAALEAATKLIAASDVTHGEQIAAGRFLFETKSGVTWWVEFDGSTCWRVVVRHQHEAEYHHGQ